jgi:hypothetical protein
MEDVKPANHRLLVAVGQIVDYPGNATNLGTDLRKDLADDGSKILAVVDCAGQDYLGYHWDFLEHKLFQIMV